MRNIKCKFKIKKTKISLFLSLALLSFFKATAMEKPNEDLEKTKKHFSFFCAAHKSKFKDEKKNNVLFLNAADLDLTPQAPFKKNKKNNKTMAYIDFLNTMLKYSTCKNEVEYYSSFLNQFVNPKNKFFVLEEVESSHHLYAQALSNERILKETMALLGGSDAVLKKEPSLPKTTILNKYYLHGYNRVSLEDKQLPEVENIAVNTWVCFNQTINNKLDLLMAQNIKLLPFENGTFVRALEDLENYVKLAPKVFELLNKKSAKEALTLSQQVFVLGVLDQSQKPFLNNKNALFFDNFSVYSIDNPDFCSMLKSACLNYLFFKEERKIRHVEKEEMLFEKNLKKELKVQIKNLKEKIELFFCMVSPDNIPDLSPDLMEEKSYYEKIYPNLIKFQTDKPLSDLIEMQEFIKNTESNLDFLLEKLQILALREPNDYYLIIKQF